MFYILFSLEIKNREKFFRQSKNQRIYIGDNNDSQFIEDQNIKKVRFKDGIDEASTNMIIDLDLPPNMYQKDKLLGRGELSKSSKTSDGSIDENKGKFELLEGDVKRSMVNGIFLTALNKSYSRGCRRWFF